MPTITCMSKTEDGKEFDEATPMTEEERALWGRKIKPARLAANLKQEELADIAGVDRKTIGNIERGKVVPQTAILRRLMVALDMTPHPSDEWPEWLKTYFQMIAPLLIRIESPRREELMRETMFMLGDAVAGGGGAGNPLSARAAQARGMGRIALAPEAGSKLTEREIAELAETAARERDAEEQVRSEVSRAAEALGFD
ncbi:hypothetical protein AXA44_02805 [Rhodococcus sp. SC4]|nr:hypothetical protein AXA44_02805 [Rhodococcus sp. SC4]